MSIEDDTINSSLYETLDSIETIISDRINSNEAILSLISIRDILMMPESPDCDVIKAYDFIKRNSNIFEIHLP